MLKPLLLTAVAAAIAGSAATAAAQSPYRGDGARYLGPPVYADPGEDQPFTQTPTYYYNHPRGYRAPVYDDDALAYDEGYDQGPPRDRGYRAYTGRGYTADQYARERRAFAENQRDLYGASRRETYQRRCYWSNRSGDERYPDWVEVCR